MLGHALQHVLDARRTRATARRIAAAGAPRSRAAARRGQQVQREVLAGQPDVGAMEEHVLARRRRPEAGVRRAKNAPPRRAGCRSGCTRARPARAAAAPPGRRAFTTAQSSSVWLPKIRALAAAYSSKLAWRSRWSAERFRNTATFGWKVSVPSSWKLDTSSTKVVSSVAPSTRPVTASPDVAAHAHVAAGLAQHRAQRGGGGGLALGARHRRHRARDVSGRPAPARPCTGTPAARAAASSGRSRGTPGDTTTSAAPVKVSGFVVAPAPGGPRRRSAAQGLFRGAPPPASGRWPRPRPPPREEPRRRDPRPRQTHDDDVSSPPAPRRSHSCCSGPQLSSSAGSPRLVSHVLVSVGPSLSSQLHRGQGSTARR